MDTNTRSDEQPAHHPVAGEPAEGLEALAAVVEDLAAQDLHGLTDAVRAERVLGLRRLLDRLEGHWLQELAGVDARGAAGADQDGQFGSTASWLRARLRMGAGAAHTSVRTARALFRGPLPQTATALTDGQLSPAHARVLAVGTQDLPAHLTAEAEPVLVEVARRLDPARLRQLVAHLGLVADPDGAQAKAERHHQRRGLWLAPTLEGMVAVDGLLEAEAGQTLMSALEPLARPPSASDARSGGQRRADALTELARRALEGGRLPKTGGVRPQLTVTVELDSLLGRPGAVGGQIGWVGPLAPEGCRRLACDGAVTRVLVTRQATGPDTPLDHLSGHPHPQASGHHGHDDPRGRQGHGDPGGPWGHGDPGGDGSVAAQLRTAAKLLPPVLGGPPTQPLELGRTTRVVQPAQRTALAVRDGGCVFPGCDRPLAWCEAHHIQHWLDGGPTDLDNLVLLCRAHHRAVHEGGWQLQRQPDGRLTATPPHRPHRRHHAAA
jgi:Domain of unknown function (DUF222)/HNH endonuclease